MTVEVIGRIVAEAGYRVHDLRAERTARIAY
jgi:hypothetical protein